MKYCPCCKEDKPDSDFYTETKRYDGLSSNCKDCKKERNRQHWKERYYPAHREDHIENVNRRRKEKKG